METKNTAHVILPVSIVKEIDSIAGKRMRSKFLAEAARERIKRIKLERALEHAAGSWKDTNHPDLAKRGAAQWVADKRKEDEQRFQRTAK